MRDQEQSRATGASRDRRHEALANRLDELSRRDVERVLERAIQIQAQRHSSDSLTAEQVKGIARELGLDDAVVDRAIREELRRPSQDEGEGRLVPERLVESAVIDGTPEEVAKNIATWMEREEGLQAVARLPDGIRWEPDTRLITSTRLVFGSAGTKALRQLPEVVHHQRPVTADEQLVELVVGTGRIKATAWGLGGGVTALGLAAGAFTAAVVPGGSDLLQFLSAAVPGLAAGATSLLLTARVWTRSVRRGMRRALDGIAHPELYRRSSRWRRRARRDDRSPFQRLVDEVVDAIEEVFD
ncbi:MAG TPA: hypothetical protein VK070_07730 [Acidimicrobiia bacterium]|nr:hypothetical protein [Acidimicrobiia bacterium]